MTPTTATAPTVTTWDIDTSHSSVGFNVRHLVISKTHGRFTRWNGSITLDEANLANSRVEVNIDADSIDTNEPQRDAHLRSADFFDVEKNPKLTFVSTQITPGAGGEFRIAGDLTIAGITRPVVLEAESLGRTADPWGGQRAGFSAKTTIDRRDFGLTWNQALEAGGVLVSDKVDIEVEAQVVAGK